MIMENFLLFAFGSIGMAHIIVDGSILESFRDFVKSFTKKINLPKLGEIVECYMCSGTWAGFFMGYIVYGYFINNITLSILTTFACGCAGGFLSNLAAMILNYIESATIINLPEQKNENI
jgi:hypothetical protein